VGHTRQGWLHLQSICHNSQFSQDRKQTDVAWCKLALDSESLQTSHRRDVKVHMVGNLKLMWLVALVGIAFLSSPGSLQVGLNVVDYLLGLSDKVRTKDHPLTRLNPVQRCMTSEAIQSFKGCHSETLLLTVVVRELSQLQTPIPFVRTQARSISSRI
jgi:hypothetical protein